MNVYCPNCENECSELAAACPKCGHPLMGSMQVPVRVEDTLDCPACGKSIIPQWTFLGREYMLLVGGLGVESHDKGRLCPLCGVDVDRWPIEQEKFRKQREAEKAEQVRRAALTPRKAAVEYAWDRVALLVAAIVLLGIMLLCAGTCGNL